MRRDGARLMVRVDLTSWLDAEKLVIERGGYLPMPFAQETAAKKGLPTKRAPALISTFIKFSFNWHSTSKSLRDESKKGYRYFLISWI